jgi:predicted transcriptional regulator
MTALSRDDLLHLVATRHDMIESLCTGTLDKRSLQQQLDVSRPTVDRAFRELEDNGILTSTGTEYELTRFGRLFCDRFGAHMADIDEMVNLGSLLSHLPASVPLEDRLLRGAEVLESQPHAPLSPVSEFGRLASGAERVEGYFNVLLPYYVSFLHRQVLEEGLAARIVLPEPVMEQAFSQHMDEISTLLDEEGFTLVKSERTVPFGIVLIDEEHVGVSIRDEENHLQGALVNDSPDAVAWAREQIERLAAEGEQYEFTRGGRSARAD